MYNHNYNEKVLKAINIFINASSNILATVLFFSTLTVPYLHNLTEQIKFWSIHWSNRWKHSTRCVWRNL